jgi:16S rRNA (guanine(1405)-N(7))-methyltransferase
MSSKKDLTKSNSSKLISIKLLGRDIDVFLIETFIETIKTSKKFNSIDEEIIFNELIRILKKDSKLIDSLKEKSVEKLSKSKEFKVVVKEVKQSLHRLYGMFQEKDKTKRDELLINLKNEFENNNITNKNWNNEFVISVHENLLSTHSSTKERLEIYEGLYDKIFEITGKPKSILDLGCGLNFLSFPYMNLNVLEYLGMDISDDDLKFLREYGEFISKYKKVKIDTKPINLIEAKNKNLFFDIKKHDVCFIFKVLEIIELSKSHKISEKIIVDVPAKWLVISFPTRTLTKKMMNSIRRGWMHLMLDRLGYEYTTLMEKNELFFVINKN